MSNLTEEQLDEIRNLARSGDALGEYELALLYMGDYFKLRAIYSIRAIYKGMLKIYDSALSASCPDIAGTINGYYDGFRQYPSTATIHELITATVKILTEVSPSTMPIFATRLNEGFASLAVAIGQILDRHYPENKNDNKITSSKTKFEGVPSLDNLYELIDTLTGVATQKGNKDLTLKLLVDAYYKGVSEALPQIVSACGYKTAGVEVVNGYLSPRFAANGNYNYPSILSGPQGGEIKATENKKLYYWRTVDFFVNNANNINHFLNLTYDTGNQSHRTATERCVSAVLASVMAWIGPGKFTLDVVDYEHTGIGSYPAQFLPDKQVKIIVRDEEWETELKSLETLIEKRARLMQSIFDYNQRNPESPEPFKIVLVQDYTGELIKVPPLTSDHPDQKEKDAHERRLKNAQSFKHLLERGYRFGIIFIVTSAEGTYKSSLGEVNLSGITYPATPYNILRVEGVSAEGDDWLMKWLSGGEEIKRRSAKTAIGDTQNGANGILTTELTDDGTDVEFRFDTVSHTHAFIIGKTGSGKSVLLHNIITGLVNRYSPDDLELYMLDLKMGGVEFNRYRRLPHLRFLLVDNSDIQIVLEIMRDIDVMMRERGKAFREAAVSNVKEYNAAHPDKKMPQVIVVIDECHAIFSMGSGREAAKEQREITERLAKIAKEGRSQGIHLIFATQTLSGSEIPPDIQKNITDYFLLKCANSDSESLVRGSSKKTEALPVGKVYYYHADRQALFQGIYNDNEALEELIEESLKRYKGDQSHGRFYFNGAQIFSLDEDALNNRKDRLRGISGTPGRVVNLQQLPVSLTLTKDYSENVLLTGINAEEQLSRTTLALMASQIAIAKKEDKALKVIVINCLDPECNTSSELVEMASAGYISLYRPSESEDVLRRLCNDVKDKTLYNDTVLYIFGQERFAELKRDQKFKTEEDSNVGAFDLFNGVSFPSPGNSAQFDSYSKAVIYLIDNGPINGLHVVIQVDKTNKLLFDEFISVKTVSSRFKHIIVLRTEMRYAAQIGISDEIKVENLSDDVERLRAYHYFDEDGSYTLFTPYEVVTSQQLKNLIN
ncbi:MAG: FtsK/SpoIIIE domain-containing protein [Muribaculum sp.]|nr:FtsK/SpoIIIE domain-containing protein [Muribaculum sp.]